MTELTGKIGIIISNTCKSKRKERHAMKNAALSGKPYAGNPHVRFDKGEVVSEKPRCGSLHYKKGGLIILSVALAFVVEAGVKIEKDIPYTSSERCKIDVRYPVETKNFPTVVWFHGGGLTGGNKHFIRIDDSIAQIAANYRLLGQDGLQDGEVCIRDAAAAVAWTLENITKYGGDPKKVYVSGMSAGGYLTMMVGMAPQYLKERGHDISELAGLAPISGQATKHYNVRKFGGDTDPQFLPKIDSLAPLAYCSKLIPPIISICGEEPWEWKCRSEENRLLISSCRALGHDKALFVSCPFADHNRANKAGLPYIELFVQGRLPMNAKNQR